MASSASSRRALIFGALLIILDSFFRIPGIPRIPTSCRSCATSGPRSTPTKIAELFRETLIPFFFLLTGLFIPDRIEDDVPVV